MDILMEGRGLTRRFQKKGQTIEAVHEVSFTLQKGTALGIVGASGSGKSTLLRCINLLETPTSGEVCSCLPKESSCSMEALWRGKRDCVIFGSGFR